MAKVTALGCAASALVAACLAVERDAWRASAAALLIIGVAGELAAERARGPGSFAVEILDALYPLDRDHADRAREGELMRVDLRLYAIVDPERPGGARLADLARLHRRRRDAGAAARQAGGRAPWSMRRARARQCWRSAGVPLLINDRVDVALAAGADGVHVGQEDMAAEDARRLLGRGAIIGLSIKTVAQAAAAPLDLIDYVGIGGVYGTTSKDNNIEADRVAGLRAHRRRRARAEAGISDLRHRRHQRRATRPR